MYYLFGDFLFSLMMVYLRLSILYHIVFSPSLPYHVILHMVPKEKDHTKENPFPPICQ